MNINSVHPLPSNSPVGQGHDRQIQSFFPESSHHPLIGSKERDEVSIPSRSKSKRRRIPKPWENDGTTKHVGNVIRSKLPGIESYDRQLEYHVPASPKITLRLERVVGTDRIRINDARYMNNLSRKIEEEEKKVWKDRVTKRHKTEHGRYRQLIIDGILEPTSDMLDLLTHPIFRVNRMMKRINKIRYTTPDARIPPPIQPMEPFEEQKRTGYLFGWHKNHYLKVNRPALASSQVLPSSLEITDDAELVPFSTPVIDEEEEADTGEETEGEDRSDISASEVDDLATYLRRESMSQARRYLNLDEGQLKKEFEIQPKSFVNAVFDESKEKPEDLFEYSGNLLMAYQREQMKTDEFCSKVHRRLFL